MTKYRKRPVVIEAAMFDGELVGDPTSKGSKVVKRLTCPEWFQAVMEEKDPIFLTAGEICTHGGKIYIATLEGTMTVSPGDWIIKVTAGEVYPCKPDIFADLYEPA